ncbi:SPCS-like protein [Mya arenaria]|uniref:O-phosphoseryl-tRNA(Sec) selenium transferase n=1 Tax=Mya arenaria TaxID=6604 RepID=A0ABY7FJY1_MYAAR|nr:SPCS-like protein [Mya arenaria]
MTYIFRYKFYTMNAESLSLCEKLVPASYVQQGAQARRMLENKIRIFIQHRKLPDTGWADHEIEILLQELSTMDSNNFPGNCGVGEREGRLYSSLVARRHFRLAHGIGRSGDITAVQPKAAGSISGQLFCCSYGNWDELDVVHAGVPSKETKRQVCLEPVVIENKLEGDELRTDEVAMETKIQELGPENIVCVMTTTSCFAPRAPDRLLEQVVLMCLFSPWIRTSLCQWEAALASAGPSLDLFITLLSMGSAGYRQLLQERKQMYTYLGEQLRLCADRNDLRVLDIKHNPISYAIGLPEATDGKVTELGGMLFTRFVSGARVIEKSDKVTTVSGQSFTNFGAHHDNFPCSNMTVAAAVGITMTDIDTFFTRFDQCLKHFRKTHKTSVIVSQENNGANETRLNEQFQEKSALDSKTGKGEST